MTMIPADAMEEANKQVAAGTDFYADMTDEERAEEGLPTRETKPETESTPSEDAPAPDRLEPRPKPKMDDETEGEGGEAGTDVESRLFEEVRELGARIDTLLGEKAPKTEEKRDERLESLLEHEDADVRYLAEQMIESKKQLTELRTAERNRIVDAQKAQDDAAFAKVMSNYEIDGKPMTQAHRDAVEDYMYENPEAGAVLTMEEATLRVFPDAKKVGPKSPPARGPGDSRNGAKPAVATIIDQGSTGGAPQGKWEPRVNETIESALAGYKLRG